MIRAGNPSPSDNASASRQRQRRATSVTGLDLRGLCEHMNALIVRILAAGALTGALDGLFAIALSVWWRKRATVEQVFQGIAGGLIGPSARDGGIATAALGLSLHFLIATIWASIFMLIVLRVRAVARLLETTRGTLAVAMIFGPMVWLAMDFLVIPLSRARQTPPTSSGFWILLVGHAFVVGLPIAWMARGLHPARTTNLSAPAMA